MSEVEDGPHLHALPLPLEAAAECISSPNPSGGRPLLLVLLVVVDEEEERPSKLRMAPKAMMAIFTSSSSASMVSPPAAAEGVAGPALLGPPAVSLLPPRERVAPPLRWCSTSPGSKYSEGVAAGVDTSLGLTLCSRGLRHLAAAADAEAGSESSDGQPEGS